MKNLKFLAISDTHLGEDTSLLTFPKGRQYLWKALQAQFGDEKTFDVEEVLLLGDIPDRTLSSTSQIVTNTNAFIQTMGSAANIKKGVYMLGNHDHTIWTKYLRLRYGADIESGITGPEGDVLVKNGGAAPGRLKDSEHILSIFFGYPHGSSWRRITEDASFRSYQFAIANPLYAKKCNDKIYVFTHGTHFRRDVTTSEWIKKLADWTQLDEVLGKIELETEDCDVNEANNLEELEQKVSGFVDTLWPDSQSNPTSRSDQLWYLLNALSAKFYTCRGAIPSEDALLNWDDLKKDKERKIPQLTPEDKPELDSLKRMKEHFLDHMLVYLKEKELLTQRTRNIVFVYGDTHDGGFGEFNTRFEGRDINIRVYNLGGWVVHNKDDHTACHVFAVDDNGDDYLLDMSFNDVSEDNRPILEQAAEDSENRQRGTSRLLRLILKLLPG